MFWLAEWKREPAIPRAGSQAPSWTKLKTFIDRDSWATTAVTFAPESKTLASGTTSGTIRFHAVPTVE
jgi:hypothetical protein